jgi:hypothetical protein
VVMFFARSRREGVTNGNDGPSLANKQAPTPARQNPIQLFQKNISNFLTNPQEHRILHQVY